MTASMTIEETQPSYSQNEYAAAFEIAKNALTYVASFQTPPTPEVYEIWYRFAEGSNTALTEQLSFAVNELKSISRDRIEQIHHEFFSRMNSNGEEVELTECLAGELEGLESMIRAQINIGDDFGAAVSSAGQNLHDDADPEEIRGCVDAVLATSDLMQDQLRDLKTQLYESQSSVEKLRADYLESQKGLLTDPLTGVGNRRFFDSQMKQSIEDFSEQKSARTLMLVDLDKFKDINDTFGHAAGDEVLRYVAAEMHQLSADASIARYGGDEFAVFVDCEDPEQGLELATKFCDHFTNNRLTMRKTGETLGNITLSIGVALLRHDDTGESWFDRADKLLYSAKQSGRNRVMAERKLDV